MRRDRHPIIAEKAIRAVSSIISSGNLSMFRGNPDGHNGGEWVQRLERWLRGYLGVKHAVSMNSATACLHSALLACGARGEVICSPYTFSASASCVLQAGLKPVFVDIEEETFCMNPLKLREGITPQTGAIIPVHLHGHPADMDEIMAIAKNYNHNYVVIEDAAQSLGAEYKGRKVGTIGDVGVFSFNQSKPISIGEGGVLVTNNDDIARYARALRNHGEVSDPELGIVGYNYRLNEIEACLAWHQLQDLDEMNQVRIELTNIMSDGLRDIEGIEPPVTYPWCKHVFYTYPMKFTSNKMTREEFQKSMADEGVYMGAGYVRPLYQLPAYGAQKDLCPVTEEMYRERLMVTDILRHPMTPNDVREILALIRQIMI